MIDCSRPRVFSLLLLALAVGLLSSAAVGQPATTGDIRP